MFSPHNPSPFANILFHQKHKAL